MSRRGAGAVAASAGRTPLSIASASDAGVVVVAAAQVAPTKKNTSRRLTSASVALAASVVAFVAAIGSVASVASVAQSLSIVVPYPKEAEEGGEEGKNTSGMFPSLFLNPLSGPDASTLWPTTTTTTTTTTTMTNTLTTTMTISNEEERAAAAAENDDKDDVSDGRGAHRGHESRRNRRRRWRWRFPEYGTPKFARTCAWTIANDGSNNSNSNSNNNSNNKNNSSNNTTGVVDCAVYISPSSRTNKEGFGWWISEVVFGYMLARVTGCALYADYGPNADIGMALFPVGPMGDAVHDWSVPSRLRDEGVLAQLCRSVDGSVGGVVGRGGVVVGGGDDKKGDGSTSSLRRCLLLERWREKSKKWMEAYARILRGVDEHDASAAAVAVPTIPRIPYYRTAFHTAGDPTTAASPGRTALWPDRYSELEAMLPGFNLETGFACAFGRLFRLAPTLERYVPGFYSDVLPALRDDAKEDALVVSAYYRTNRADFMFRDERAAKDDKKIKKNEEKGNKNNATALSSSIRDAVQKLENKEEGEREANRVFDRFRKTAAECLLRIEDMYLSGNATIAGRIVEEEEEEEDAEEKEGTMTDDGMTSAKNVTRIVWSIVSDSPALKHRVAETYSRAAGGMNHTSSFDANDVGHHLLPRTVVYASTRGGHTKTVGRTLDDDDDFTSDLVQAVADWYIVGESDVVLSVGSLSYGQMGAVRTARPLYGSAMMATTPTIYKSRSKGERVVSTRTLVACERIVWVVADGLLRTPEMENELEGM